MRKSYSPNLQAMLGNANFIALLTNLDKKTIGPAHEPLMKHVKYCQGCADCIRYSVLLKIKTEMLDNTEMGGGITRGEALKMRKTHSIHYWFPRGDELRKDDGTFDPQVFVFLKTVDGPNGSGFTNPEIFQYFGLNSGEAARFLQTYPQYKNANKDVLIADSYDAINYCNKKFFGKKTTRVKRVSY